MICVLVWKPEWGESIFQWEEKEKALQEIYSGQNRIEGTVLSVERKSSGEQAYLRLTGGGSCIVLLPDDMELQPGNRVRLQGEIRWPEAASNPGQWDGKLYARIHRFLFYFQPETVEVLDKREVFWRKAMAEIKNRFSRAIDDEWDAPWNGVMKSMLLGEKAELDAELRQQLSQAGIAHIIAISGLHLSMIGELLAALLRRFQKQAAVRCEVAGILWLYVVFTGAAVATVRAAIMMSMKAAAHLLDREEDPVTTLILTACILLIYQPLYLLDAGFALSFGALLGLQYGKLWVMPLPGIPYRVRRYLAGGVGVSLTTLPLSLWFFGQSSIWGFLLNLWVLPMMQWVITGGIAAIGLSLLHPAVGKGVSMMVELLLKSFQWGSEWILRLPGSNARGKPELYQLMAFYGLLGLLILYYGMPASRRRKAKSLLCGLGLSALLGWRASAWRVMYLDVGQGDCAVIEWESKVFIIDAGPQYEEVLKPYLIERGIYEIDGLILSHPDLDHIEGMLQLAQDPDFKVKGLWEAEEACQDTESRRQLESYVLKQEGFVRKVRKGYALTHPEFVLQVLGPDREYEDTNEGSLVVQVEIEAMRFLFTGDMEGKAESDQKDEWKKADVLKVAHHGSKTSTGSEFLRAVQPKLAVIGCGAHNTYGHPHEEVLQRLEAEGIPWAGTHQLGAIWVEKRFGNVQYRYFNKKEES